MKITKSKIYFLVVLGIELALIVLFAYIASITSIHSLWIFVFAVVAFTGWFLAEKYGLYDR